MQDSATAYLPPHLIYKKQALLCSMPLALHMLYVIALNMARGRLDCEMGAGFCLESHCSVWLHRA